MTTEDGVGDRYLVRDEYLSQYRPSDIMIMYMKVKVKVPFSRSLRLVGEGDFLVTWGLEVLHAILLDDNDVFKRALASFRLSSITPTFSVACQQGLNTRRLNIVTVYILT